MTSFQATSCAPALDGWRCAVKCGYRRKLRPAETFIEFGHNDQGDFSVEQFKTNLLKYVTDARAAKATPVLFTPVARKGAKANDYGFLGLDQATRELALAEQVALVDLTAMTFTYYATLPDKSVMFATASEGTHFSEFGATQVSKLVAEHLKTTSLALKTLVR